MKALAGVAFGLHCPSVQQTRRVVVELGQCRARRPHRQGLVLRRQQQPGLQVRREPVLLEQQATPTGASRRKRLINGFWAAMTWTFRSAAGKMADVMTV